MHQTRKHSSTKLPNPRKGTKYLARASSDLQNSVPVVIAIRDILKLAKTAKEVKQMIKGKMLTINWTPVRDYHESIKIFNILTADKTYSLSILPTGKFFFEEISKPSSRLCKVLNKKILKDNIVQLNLHDGSNVLSKEKIKIQDSIYLDSKSKISKHVPFEKGKEVFVIAGRYKGLAGKLEGVTGNIAKIKFKENSAEIPSREVVAR